MTKQNKGRKLFAVSASAALVASAIVPVASANADFTDASKINSWAQEAVEFFVENEVINGYEDGSFKPQGNVTRAEAATMFAKGLELDTEEESGLTDVDGHWAEAAINAVAGAGIVNGYEDGSFKPENKLSRAEAAKMIVEALGFEEAADVTNFTDVTGHWAEEHIALAVGAGVLNGKSNSVMDPDAPVTREDFAAMLYRAFDAAGLLEDVTPEPPVEVEAAIESVTALSKTKVEVKFNVAVDEVAKENFSIEGASVTGAELSEDQTTVTLDVTGLDYDTEYTVVVQDVKVEGEVVEFGSADFTTPSVTEDFTLKVTPAATVVTANGADNTVIKFELLNEAGEVDTDADNMVLEIATTFGNLATNRVTVQDGVGQVVLSSEFSTKEVIAKITAQIIEASADYKELIGKVPGETTVTFVPAAATTDPNAVTFQDAESNQADRVVLYFDKEVSPATFVKTTTDGKFVTDVAKTKQILKDNVTISVAQGTTTMDVVGIVSVPGNPKAVEVLLSKNTILTDNAKVDLDVKIGTTRNQRSFTLTDARRPEFTGVTPTNLRTLDLKFSESVLQGDFSIDGLLDSRHFDVVYGEFDPVTGVDKRDTATLTLKDTNATEFLYFKAGLHSITVTQLKDFAAQSDVANVSTTQTLNFSVVADTTAPVATAVVESPEQIRLKFNKEIKVDATVTDIEELINKAFKVYDETNKTWVNLNNHSAFKGTATGGTSISDILTVDVYKNEYVVELKEDWTEILVSNTDTYHNYKFKFEFGKDSFVSLTNGIKNADFSLDLSYNGSPLTKADNLSPEIVDITQTINPSTYEIAMSEPVKLQGLDKASAHTGALDTPSKAQTAGTGIPTVVAEFQGKDKDGKAVVVSAIVTGYSDKDGGDKKFHVTTSGDTLEMLVNQKGYNENWTVVVRSISDDIGNTASTLTKDFVVKSTATPSGFQIKSPENNLAQGVFAYDSASPTTPDVIKVTFTSAVNVAGPDNLTSVYNWTLNGTKLSNLSNVASIRVEDGDNNPTNGYETVVITFADDRAFGASSNVISVTKGIKALNGTVLIGEFEVVAETVLVR